MGLAQAVRRWFGARPYLRELRARPELGLSTLFDPAYYRQSYKGPLPPLLHYIVAGAFEGMNPHPWFDTEFYLRKYPDLEEPEVNPLFHYLLHGAAEGRKPHPFFQPDYYAAQLAEAPAQPLLHFLANASGHANPHPLFDRHANVSAPRPAHAPKATSPNLRRVLIHYHIFKNAGTTIEEILANTFYERYDRLDRPDYDALISNAEVVRFVRGRPALQALSSHQIRYPRPTAPGILFFDICFLRDPLDRIRSTYDYFRIRPAEGEEVSELSNRLAFREFLECMVEQHPWRINDAQVNILAGRGVDDDPATPADLERALAVMREASFLGVVDLYRESMAVARHWMRPGMRPAFPHFNFDQPAANVSAGMRDTLDERIAAMQAACTPGVWSELLRLTALDRELVKQARAEVLRRLAAIPREDGA